MTTTPVLGMAQLVEGIALPATKVNDNERLAEQFAQHGSVKDKDLAAPPVSPADGDAYLVAPSPTGAWAGKAGYYAFYQAGTGWRFVAPRTGMSVDVNDEGATYRYASGAWSPVTGGTIAPTLTMTASEAITAGMFVNIHNSSGAKIRKANATDETKPADGYAPASIASTASGAVLGPGSLLSGLSGLTPGASYYLDTTAGGITATAPSGAGNLVQFVGRAVSASQLFYNPQPGIIL